MHRFTVQTFNGADTWTLSSTLSPAQVVLEQQNFFAMTSGSEGKKDMRFIKSELEKACEEVQHVDAKSLTQSCINTLMLKCKKSGLLTDGGEPNSRLNLRETTSDKKFIDSDVNYTHVQNLLGVDTNTPFVWDSKGSVELFATVRRVFFGTLHGIDSNPHSDYFEPPLMEEFADPPARILNADMIQGQGSDIMYLQSIDEMAQHSWKSRYIQRVDHLLSFVLADRLHIGYYNWHNQKFEEAEAARKKAEAEAARVAAEEAEAARIAAEEAHKKKEKEMQQVKQTAEMMSGWNQQQIAALFAVLSPAAIYTGQTLVANATTGSSSSTTPGISSTLTRPLQTPSAREIAQGKIYKAFKDEESKRVEAEAARKKAEAEAAHKKAEAEAARIAKEKAEAARVAENVTGGSTGGSSSSNNAGTTTTTTNPTIPQKPVENKKDVFSSAQLEKIMTWWHGDGDEDTGLRGIIGEKVRSLSEGEEDPSYFNLEAVQTLDKEAWMKLYVEFYTVTYPFDLFGEHVEMMDQIEKENGKACRWALEGFTPERNDVTNAEYNEMEKKICKETGKTYVEVPDVSEGEDEGEEEEDDENKDENEDENDENEDEVPDVSEGEDENEDKEVVDLTVSIASKIDDLDVEDTLKEYLQTPEGKALCIFAYRSQLGEKNKHKIPTVNSTSLKNKKITFGDIEDLNLTEDFIQTYVIDFAKHVHEYCSNRKYDMGSLVMLTAEAFKTLDAAQRRRLPEKEHTVWRVTHHNTGGDYEIVAEFNTTEKVDAMEVDLMPPVVLSFGGKEARKRPRDSGGASSSTGAITRSSPQKKKQKRKITQRKLPNVTAEDVKKNTSRLQKKPKTPTQSSGFRT